MEMKTFGRAREETFKGHYVDLQNWVQIISFDGPKRDEKRRNVENEECVTPLVERSLGKIRQRWNEDNRIRNFK